jgi:alkylhydroperoxidase family enzyme
LVRLNLVAAWRDAKVFTDAEPAALELTEQGTLINTYNRLNVISRNQGGDYQPGQWG